MQVITITAVIILLVGLASDATCSTNAKDLVKDDNDILKELLQRMDKMQSHIEQMETNNYNKIDQLKAKMEAENKNMTVGMESVVEQQTTLTSGLYTVSQTLPFCCCQYQNTTGAHK